MARVSVERDQRPREEAPRDGGRAEERFRRVVEWAPSAMVMIDQAGLIELVNAQAERVFGYGRAELLGQSVEMLVPDRFRGGHPGRRRSFFVDPCSRPMGAGRELYAQRKDGGEFPVEIGLNPIETERGTMVLSAIVDISDRKHREAEIEARIAHALKEKDILLGEIHHRVKNNLQIVDSLLELQLPNVTDPRLVDVLRDAQGRIRSMALIHQTLYQSQDFAHIDFKHFLETVVPDLSASYALEPDRIAVAIDAVEVLLPIKTAVPLGLILNELITNAFKHAFPDHRRGRITVGLGREADGSVVLSISDDGVGIPDGLDLAQTQSLGFQLVPQLAEQLAADLTIRRSNPTRFELRLPTEP